MRCKHGYAVDISADGVDALSMATEYEYDAIVLDLMIPGEREPFDQIDATRGFP